MKTVLNDLETKGTAVFPGFFDEATVAALSSEGRELIDSEAPFFEYFRGGKSCRVATAPCNLDAHKAWDIFSAATQAFKGSGIDDVAGAYLGDGFGRAHFIYDYSAASHREELFPLHFDNFDGQLCLKAFIYLTDCDETNGAFRYVPSSHHLANAHVAELRKTTKVMKDGDKTLSKNPQSS